MRSSKTLLISWCILYLKQNVATPNHVQGTPSYISLFRPCMSLPDVPGCVYNNV